MTTTLPKSNGAHPLFDSVCVFDGSVGRYGQYVWKDLPNPMVRADAEFYCGKMGWCPPERFRPVGIFGGNLIEVLK